MRKIIFMGTPEFSVPPLKALHKAGYEIVAVYSQPPRPAGRGMKEQKSPVHLAAEKLKIPVFTPPSLKDKKAVAAFKKHQADLAVVVAYGLILPQEVLDIPPKGCINIHASLLPKWRGAAPIHRAIINGDHQTGITIMKMDAGLDTGPMLKIRKLAITKEDTTGSMHDKLADLGAKLIVETLNDLDKIVPAPQPEKGVSYAHKITREEGEIDWSKSTSDIENLVRGLNPWPVAWTTYEGARLKVYEVEAFPGFKVDNSVKPGQIVDNGLTVITGDGAVKLLTLQRAGAKPQQAAEFLRGYKISSGEILGEDSAPL